MSPATTAACPLCDRRCYTRNHLREHLNENHHKSELVDGYLTLFEAAAGDSARSDPSSNRSD